jgi:plastocyanin
LALRANGTVAVWGVTNSSHNYGQTNIPAGLTNVVGAAVGWHHNLALKADGTVVAWGAGASNSGSSPHYGQSQVPIGLSNVVAVAGGGYHSLALKADGTVVAWGAGMSNTGVNPDWGQSRVPDGLTNVVAIAAGTYHSLALRADGSIVAWGAGATNTGANPNYGQSAVPVGLSNAIGIAGGGYHTLALVNSGGPYITVHPVSQTASAGTDVTLMALATGTQPLTYQWQCNGTNLPGGTGAVLTLANVQSVNEGSYSLVASNAQGTACSAAALLTVIAPPSITTQPTSLSVNAGSNVTFTVVATGTQPLGYQWMFNGASILGATGSSYTRFAAQESDAGSYAVMVTNSLGSTTSSNALLTVNEPPAITSHPQSASVTPGSDVTFTVAATGTAPLSYQWRFGAADIAGATGSAYTLNGVHATNAGTYSVLVFNVAGTATSSNAVLTVQAASAPHIDSITSLPDGRIELLISGGPGSFAIECAPEFSGWTQLSTLTATGAVFQYIDPETNQASRFYRVRQLP